MDMNKIRFLPLALGLTMTAAAVGCADDSQTDVGDDIDSTASDTVDTTATETNDTEVGTTADTTTDATDTTDATTTDTTDATTTDTTDATTDTTDATTDTTDATTDTTDATTDTTTTTTTGNMGCQAPAAYVDCDGTPGNLTNDPFKALGINCSDDPTETIVANSATMHSNNPNAWRVAAQFGSANQNPGDNRFNGKLWAANLDPFVSPGEDPNDPNDDVEIPNNTSAAILIVSSGVVAAANGQSVVIENNGSQTGNGNNNNDDAGGLPLPLSPTHGSNNGQGGTPFMNCDGVNDCSDSLHNQWFNNNWNNPDDKLWMDFTVTVPEGTNGYVFDFAYFSSEFPTYYNTVFNDLFIAWQVSETYTGNVTFVNNAPLTITSLEDAGAFQYKANAPQLSGTGFEGHAGTGWFTARGAAAPGEDLQVVYFISDMGDSILATGALLDNFRWECAGCIPSEVDSCGIQPQ